MEFIATDVDLDTLNGRPFRPSSIRYIELGYLLKLSRNYLVGHTFKLARI